MKQVLAIIAASSLAAALPAQAQENTLSERQVELYSEMWAMAGVCSQYHQFRVDDENLADLLNGDLASLQDSQRQEIIERKNTKLAEIGARIDEMLAMSHGRGRVRAVEENTEILLTRCQRLANNDFAGDYFARS